MKSVVWLAILLAWAPALSAQLCTEQATIGQFEISFEGAAFDGSDTEFEYCVTGLDDPALSHWSVALATECIDPEDLTGCGPRPCDYQVDDPTTGVTGIKWDDLEVDPGETECFTFKLAGDWTALIGDVQVGLKAGQGTHFGDMCGPVCRSCESSIEVLTPADGQAEYKVSIVHRRPPTVETRVYYTLSRDGRRIKRWKSDALTLDYGDYYSFTGPIPTNRRLRKGEYVLQIRMRGMSRWIERETSFVIE